MAAVNFICLQPTKRKAITLANDAWKMNVAENKSTCRQPLNFNSISRCPTFTALDQKTLELATNLIPFKMQLRPIEIIELLLRLALTSITLGMVISRGWLSMYYLLILLALG